MKEKVANSVFVTHFAENYWQTVRNPHRPETSLLLFVSQLFFLSPIVYSSPVASYFYATTTGIIATIGIPVTGGFPSQNAKG